MSATSDLIKNWFLDSLTARAAYAYFTGEAGSGAARASGSRELGVSDVIAALTNPNRQANFSIELANYFAANFAVVDQEPNSIDGYSGTLFARRVLPIGLSANIILSTQTPGAANELYSEYVFAQRGTEIALGSDLVFADIVGIFMSGGPHTQRSHMNAYWNRLIGTEANNPINDLADVVAALGTQGVTATGHSLGGALATAFMLDSSLAARGVTFNGAGLAIGTLADVKIASALRIKIAESLFGSDESVSNPLMTNLVGDAGFEVTAGANTVLGGSQFIAIEDTPGFAGIGWHSMSNLTDSLAAYYLLSLMASNLGLYEYQSILLGFSSDPADMRESFARWVKDAFSLTGEIGPEGQRVILNRVEWIEAQGATIPPSYEARVLAHMGAGTIFALSQRQDEVGAAVRHSLLHNAPLAVIGAGLNWLQRSELALDQFSKGELQERSNYLYHLLASNRTDTVNPYTVAGDVQISGIGHGYFAEEVDGTQVVRRLSSDSETAGIGAAGSGDFERFMFGGTNGDTLNGSASMDRIFGSGGNDTLDGGAGNDELDGGAGTDTYVYVSGDGNDTIADVDGLGQIQINGVLLSGSLKLVDRDETGYERFRTNRVWHAEVNGANVYLIEFDGDVETGATLRIEGDGLGTDGSITILNFVSNSVDRNDFGIQLDRENRAAFRDPSAAMTEAGATMLSVLLAAPAAVGTTIRVTISAFASAFQLVDGATTHYFNNGYVDIALTPGQTSVELALLSVGDIDGGNLSLAVTSEFRGADGTASDPSVLNLAIAVVNEIAGTPATTYTLRGDQAPLLDNQGVAVLDSWGNIIPIGPAPGRDDDLFGTTANDSIITGNGTNHVQADQGGNDVVTGGSGIDGVMAGAGNDFLVGAGGGDRLSGGAGEDRIFGESEISNEAAILAGQTDASIAAFNDFLRGADGNDVLIGSAARDVLSGGAGADTLLAGAGDDLILGDTDRMAIWQMTPTGPLPWDVVTTVTPGGGPNGADLYVYTVNNSNLIASSQPDGNDLIHAGAGNDAVLAGGGDDLIFGESGDDRVSAGAGNDTVLGGDDNDDLTGGDADDTGEDRDFLDGGLGNDRLFGANGDDTLFGGGGNDVLYGDLVNALAGADYLNGEDGDDTLDGGGRDDVLIGGAGNDSLQGDDIDTPEELQGDDFLDGGAGDDSLVGLGGADTLVGGDGNDQLFGDGNADADANGEGDSLFGGNGNDTLVGGGGADTLDGGANNDNLYGDSTETDAALHGDDALDGGDGDDVLVGNGGSDTLLGGAGNDTMFGDSSGLPASAEGDDLLDGGDGNDHMDGGGGNDTLLGGTGTDLILGGTGADYLDGGAGADQLQGGDGDDILIADSPDDVMFGQAGNDTYIVSSADGRFQISDTEGVNTIVVNGTSLADLQVEMSDGGVFLIYPDGAYMSMSVDTFNSIGAFQGVEPKPLSAADLRGLFTPLSVVDSNVRLKTGVSVSQVQYRGYGNDLVILYGGAVADWVDTAALTANNVLSRKDDGALYGGGAGSKALVLTNWYRSDSTEYVNTVSDLAGGTVSLSTLAFSLVRVFEGQESGDVLVGSSYADDLRGHGGADQLSGGSGNDSLSGGEGDDWLEGNDGNDTLKGEVGDDFLEGGSGDDTYLFDTGDGLDVIDDSGGTTDKVQFGAGILPGDLVITESIDGLTVRVGAQENGDSILILSREWTGGQIVPIDRFQFADSTIWSAADIESHISGNRLPRVGQTLADIETNVDEPFSLALPANTFYDPTPSDVLTYSATLADGAALPGWLQFNATTRTFSGTPGASDAANLSIVIRATDQAGATAATGLLIAVPPTITVDGTESYDNLNGYGNVRHVMYGHGGNDNLSGSDKNDVIAGGAGYDTLFGGLGGDTYVWNQGDWTDQIFDAGNSSTVSTDVIKFGSGVAAADVRAARSGDDLLLYVRDPVSNEEKLALSVGGDFNTTGNNSIERVQFADGTVWARADIETKVLLGAGSNDTLLGYMSDDVLAGAGGDDSIRGGYGADDIRGGSGNDQLIGESDNDTYRFALGDGYDEIADYSGVNRIAFDAGISTTSVTLFRTSGVGFLTANGYVTSADDLIVKVGGDGQYIRVENYYNTQNPQVISEIAFADGTVWDGSAIAARVTNASGTADTFNGTVANNSYTVDHRDDVIVESASGGTDTVTSTVNYTLAANVENLALSGSFALAGIGNSSANTITGNTFDNVLDGAGGADVLIGGAGNDKYHVYTVNDGLPPDTSATLSNFQGTITEGANAGYDTIIAHDAWSAYLPANVEALIVDGVLEITSGGVYSEEGWRRHFVGNALDNVIDASHSGLLQESGLVLDGGAGADLMIGSEETYLPVRYIVDNAGDKVVVRNTGLNIIETTISYSIPYGVTEVQLAGSANISITGNELDNTFYAAENTGANVLTGGAGNDTYHLGAGDTVVESSGGGNDTVILRSPVAGSFSLSGFANVENVSVLDSVGAVNLTGTAEANRLMGNAYQNSIQGLAGDDYLEGMGGNDTLSGGQGNDTYVVLAGDTVVENSDEGIDTVVSSTTVTLAANVENLTLQGGGVSNGTGNALDNVIAGGAGTHLLTGGAGNDTYIVKSTQTSAVESAGQGLDEVRSNVSFTLGQNFENLTLLENSSAMDATGNSLGNVLTGNSYANVLDGGAGADTLSGGLGDDTYILDDAGDTILEAGNAGIDSVRSSNSYALGANLENLLLLGSSNLNATGNALDNVLTGNAGTNVLTGGLGNDTYVVQSLADSIIEAANEGTDTQVAAFSFTVAANVENGTLTGSGNLNISGNVANNILTGNSGQNVLAGGAGDDTYYVQNAGDSVLENLDEGQDTVVSSVSFTLGSNVENLTLLADAYIENSLAVGNSLGNTLIGNAYDNELQGQGGDDLLDGGYGTDLLKGGAGNDTYVIDAQDQIVEANGEGNDTVLTTFDYTLVANVENARVVGGSYVNLVGNTFDNVLVGNEWQNTLDGGAGNDTLDGGAGDDHLVGGLGDDIFIVDNLYDTTIEVAGEGIDTVRSSYYWTLGADIENLVLLGSQNIRGTGNSLNNTIDGNSGNNQISGGAGADTMRGWGGNDQYTVENVLDVVIENANEGKDKVTSSISYALTANVEDLTLSGSSNINAAGNELRNALTGNAGINVLDGGAGADFLTGGAGDDTYLVDDSSDLVTELSGGGTDTVQAAASYALSSNVERLTLVGSADLNATGNSSANILTGNSGANILDGGAGSDTLIGGAGNDIYVVDTGGDVVTEAVGGGIDEVRASSTYSLAMSSEIEKLLLTGSQIIDGTGNEFVNDIMGNVAANVLDGKGGADSLTGAGGNDTYIIDDAGDVVIELASEGTDLIQSSVSYTASANVEKLTLTGTSAINATGNALANQLTGNSGSNILDGGAGLDTMAGGAGDDTYIVDDSLDAVTESASAGIDQVFASVNFALSGNVEKLTLTGAGNINATGNTLANTLTGNSGANTLDGGSGADSLYGGAGDDIYVVDNAGDVVTEDSANGIDEVRSSVTFALGVNFERLTLTGTAANATGNDLNNVLTGNGSANRLDGGLGADSMAGGAGNDTYVVENVGDIVTENAAAGTDTVESWISYTLGADVEKLTLMGTGSNNATGNTLVNTLTGNSADNILDGGAGADTLIGGTGNDTYILDTAGETITEAASAGTDSVLSSVTYSLATNVENLTLTGTANIGGTGNSSANTLIGNSGNNALSGGTGADTMIGGLGDDTYTVDVAGDVVTEVAGEGIDLVQSGATFTLSTAVENLTLTGSSAISGTGNELANSLLGNSGSNTLTGGDGNDTLNPGSAGTDILLGGLGDDTYIVGRTSGITVTEAGGEGNDTVQASVTHTLATNVENLVLGTGSINGTGNASNNVITGGSGANTLAGGAGDDTLNGLAGADSITGGLGADIYQYTSGGAADTINNVSADSLIDRLQFTDLASSEITFSKSGNNLVMTRTAVPTDKVTVTNWFSATANRLDFVNFTNIEKTAAQIDALFASGGTGGVFMSVAPRPVAMRVSADLRISGSFAGIPELRAWNRSDLGVSALEGELVEAPAGAEAKLAGKSSAAESPIWRPIKSFMEQSAGADTLGAKMAAEDALNPTWRPIKSFPANGASDEISVGVTRLIDAMTMFGAERNIDSGHRAENPMSDALEQIAAHHGASRAQAIRAAIHAVMD